MEQDIVSLTSSGDVLFMMLGAVMVFAYESFGRLKKIHSIGNGITDQKVD